MAVYTHVPAEMLAELVARYDLGALISAKGIAEGVENSNYLVETERAKDAPAKFITDTALQKRIETDRYRHNGKPCQ